MVGQRFVGRTVPGVPPQDLQEAGETVPGFAVPPAPLIELPVIHHVSGRVLDAPLEPCPRGIFSRQLRETGLAAGNRLAASEVL
jgi:hypothetical protein